MERDNELQDFKMALTMMVRVFEKAEKTKDQERIWSGAKEILVKHFKPSDILRKAIIKAALTTKF